MTNVDPAADGAPPAATADTDRATLARTVIAGARHAILTLSREQVRGWVGLVDDGGEPVLLVTAASPPVAAGLDGARARVDVPGHDGERVTLVGDLRPLPGTAAQVARRLSTPERPVGLAGGADELTAVALSVLEVVLFDAGTDAGGARIPLAAYALAEPDLVAAYAADLAAHLNTTHATQVTAIATAADRLGTVHGPGVGELAGAQVSRIDRDGLELWRVGADGAERARLTFRRPLEQPRDLGTELRYLLRRAAGQPERSDRPRLAGQPDQPGRPQRPEAPAPTSDL